MAKQVFNNWNVSYSTIAFLAQALTADPKVASFKRKKDINFHIKLTSGAEINALLVDEYVLGLAAVRRALNEFPGVEYIVTGGNWNGYTPDAKKFGQENEIGIFNLGEFLSALRSRDPKNYRRVDDKGKPVYAFKET
jgi:hypothetical protein